MTSLSRSDDTAGAFGKLLDVIRILRSENGCPWDKKQTPQSFHPYILEEYHEMVQAINDGNPGQIADELGDLIFLVVLVAYMFEQAGITTIAEILDGAVEKMVRRHPHVFGDAKVSDSQEVIDNWAKIKASEAAIRQRDSILAGVPRSLPALVRAQKLSRRAAKVGFDWINAEDVFGKVEEELHELKQAVSQKSLSAAEEELGDLLFVLANAARHLDINSEMALTAATDKFERRFRHIEARLAEESRKLEDTSLQEMDELWDEAKTLEKGSTKI